jgi:hypothetical protein
MPGGISYQAYVSSSTPATWSTYGPKNKTETLSGGTMSSSDSGINSISLSGTTGGSCSGGGCTMTNVVLSPQFMGATGTGMAVGITTTATTSSGTQHTGQVQVYKR